MQSNDASPYSDLAATYDLLTLDEHGVHDLLSSLGYSQYLDQLVDHGISGDVLVHLDHQSLKDVGVHSVGHRLDILKAVYSLKVLQDVPIEEGHYVPPSEELDDATVPSSQIISLLTERDDRIRTLEHEVIHLHSALHSLREEALSIARTAAAASGAKPRPSLRSPTSSGFAHPLSNASTLSRSNSLSNPSTTSSSIAAGGGPGSATYPRSRGVATLSSSSTAANAQLHPSTAQSLHGLPDSPHSPGIDSPRMAESQQYHQQQQQQAPSHSSLYPSHQYGQQQYLGVSSTGYGQGAGDISINGITTPTTPTAPALVHPLPLPPPTANASLQPSETTSPAPNVTMRSQGDANASVPSSSTATGPTQSTSSSRRERDPSTTSALGTSGSSSTSTATTTTGGGGGGGGGGSDSNNPYRSFRVTLEDPCYKVLPAALKKYKINDDWRLYALFICYGNTERCLAYDEKPLLLFQRLKESNDNPVFMLRHIKDIKSPISVAAAKHAQRRDKRPNGVGSGVERSLMGVNRDGSAAPSAGQATGPANGLQPNARPTRLHHPPVLLPVGKERDKATLGEDEPGEGGAGAGAGGEGLGASLTEGAQAGGAGSRQSAIEKKGQGYCIAIYPYLAEREDEFDVAVGDTFIILSKTKGWWVVHRDSPPPSLSSSTNSNPDTPPQARKSAWVPAGCLLETSVPPLGLLASSNSASATTSGANELSSSGSSRHQPQNPHAESNAASVPILPSYVVSVSTPGVALMDYSPRGTGELEVKKGQALRILKRYNHWSYAIKEDGGRGWVPSWFCGRANKGDGTPTTPTTATSTGPSQPPPASSSTTSTSDPTRPATAPSAPPSASSASSNLAPLSSTSTPATSKPSISIALPSPGAATGGIGAAKSAGPVLSGGSAANGVGSNERSGRGEDDAT
ncbi:hypothetical protein JCM10212_004356 [Sporobolomyces blumeae]